MVFNGSILSLKYFHTRACLILFSSESDSEPRSAAGAGFQIYQLAVVLAAGFHRTSRTCRARSRPTTARRVGACCSLSAANNRWLAVAAWLALAHLASSTRRPGAGDQKSGSGQAPHPYSLKKRGPVLSRHLATKGSPMPKYVVCWLRCCQCVGPVCPRVVCVCGVCARGLLDSRQYSTFYDRPAAFR